jgi:hypothetical protein
MFISTLRNYIEAIGGELDIVARFPDVRFISNNLASRNHYLLTRMVCFKIKKIL